MALDIAFLDAIRAKTSLSSLIGETLPLQRAGLEWKACCPFHEEKTPSFTVSDEKGFYHCFGCGAHGDAIRWLTDQRHMPFREAVQTLADAAGMEIPVEDKIPGKRRGQSSAKKGGAKLNRTETVTIRLDPKLNYLCELASRAQRRTKSSFIEWAILNSLGDVTLPDVEVYDFNTGVGREATLGEKANQLWQVDEPDRVVALALYAPSLLSHEEQVLWRLIRENGYLWRGRYDARSEWAWELEFESLIIERLRENWDLFRLVANGERDERELPAWQKTQHQDTLDDDLPF